jgi:site-specific DNA-cytosine methylase
VEVRRLLVACEYSGVVREAFKAKGWDAWSCDLLPTEIPGQHFQCDVLEVIGGQWDMMIAFPPCTDLCVSGAKHFARKRADGSQQRSIDFFMALANAPIKHIAIENPVGIMSTQWRKPDQIIQPWQHGHEATKTTCLWLKNLPKITPTNIVGKGARHVTKGGNSLPEWYNLPPSADRWKIRSATFQGIANAMAEQWSSLPTVRPASAVENLGAIFTWNTMPTVPA